MTQDNKNQPQGNGRTPVFSARYDEQTVRRRIRNYVECGGVMPISSTGESNIARLFRIPVELVRLLIAEESAKIGEEVDYAS